MNWFTSQPFSRRCNFEKPHTIPTSSYHPPHTQTLTYHTQRPGHPGSTRSKNTTPQAALQHERRRMHPHQAEAGQDGRRDNARPGGDARRRHPAHQSSEPKGAAQEQPQAAGQVHTRQARSSAGRGERLPPNQPHTRRHRNISYMISSPSNDPPTFSHS